MVRQDRMIYLHFFDRELRDSVASNLTDEEAKEILLTALFMSTVPLYASFSNVYECVAAFPAAVKIAFICESMGCIQMLTNMRTAEEYLASRRDLYGFDKDRYPYYFLTDDPLWPRNTVCITGDSTTTILKKEMFGEIMGNCSYSKNVSEPLISYLGDRQKNTLTYNALERVIYSVYRQLKISDHQYRNNARDIRKMISRQYSMRYLNIYGGTIVTGIRSLGYYDFLAEDTFLTSFPVYRQIYKSLFELVKGDYKELIAMRISDNFCSLNNLVHRIILGLRLITGGRVEKAVNIIKLYHANSYRVKNYDEFVADCVGLYANILRCDDRLGDIMKMQRKILLEVATETELKVILKRLNELGTVVPILGELSYYMTTVNSVVIYVVICEQGSGGSGGSILTTEESVRVLGPDYVIMGGIAWGARKDKQQIGDVIISNRIWDYDLKKVKPDGNVQPRGTIMSPSPKLLQMFRMMGVSIETFNIEFGLIASGSILFNNKNEINKLKKMEPELIGGEMEATGMTAACFRKNVDCIMVKGICDWGYNKSSKYQELAANNSIETIMRVLKQLIHSEII